ncbi:MAG: rRNA pseudouridine synthase [Nitrospirae bacterium]|nr:MAG: rRNA pseudouridine synthase [Nitrospirota bacterium]
MPTVRLQKFLADCGLCSRREAEEWILDGRVEVNGRPALRLGITVDPERDAVRVDGRRVRPRRRRHYLLLYKPRGVVSTVRDDRDRPTVLDCLPASTPRVYPAGRLDFDTEGVLLLTDDGELAARLTHPRHGVVKVYRARVSRHPTPKELARLRRGLRLEDGPARPRWVKVVKRNPKSAWLEIAFVEGRNRLVRRYLQRAGLLVERLVRVAQGPLTLEGLRPGDYRPLTRREVAALRQAAAEAEAAPAAPRPRRRRAG